MPSPLEFTTRKPEVFRRPDLSSVVYAETRRVPSRGTSLSGNLGVSPMILGEENYARTQSPLPYDEWRTQEFNAATNRLLHLKELTGLDDVAYLRLPHSTNLIDLDARLGEVSLDTPFEKRSPADASVSTTEGVGSLLAVGDCAPASVAFEGGEAIAQKHIGIRGAAKEIIPITFERLRRQGLSAGTAAVYIGPFAHKFQMNRTEFEELNEIVAQGSDEVKQEYRLFTEIGPTGYPILDLGRMICHQLVRAGVTVDNIQMSPHTTLTNKHLYSNYTTVTEGVPDGRFGALIGKAHTSRR